MKLVSLIRDTTARYPVFPYAPPCLYPELEVGEGALNATDESNRVYAMVRDALRELGCDSEHYGSAEWNPLGCVVKPGDTVVIKPNLVRNLKKRQDCITTHPSVVRVVVDYALIALKGQGRIIVGDAPGAETDFDEIANEVGYQALVDLYAHNPVAVSLVDYRALKTTGTEGIWTGVQKTNGKDAPQHTIVNLGEDSVFCLENTRNGRFHGGGYEINETMVHHHDNVHEYCVSKQILEADVLISIPKLKTHKKAGLTCCLKNLVGINCDKNFLPHFTMGPANSGGDEMPAIGRINTKVMGGYNVIRRVLIGRFWMILGRPSAFILDKAQSLSGRKKKETRKGSSIQPDVIEKLQADEKDLGQWLHSRLSGQPVAAGSWPGNETICRMIIDLNQIAIRADKHGRVNSCPSARKLFFIVDGIVAGMGNGPISAIPCNTCFVGAGFNGLVLDTQILIALGIKPGVIPLYKKAQNYDWMLPNDDSLEGCVANGQEIEFGIWDDAVIVPPDGWDFYNNEVVMN